MSAPMDKFTGRRMVRKLAELGGIGVLPRKQTEREDLRLIRDLTDENVPFVGLRKTSDKKRHIEISLSPHGQMSLKQNVRKL